MSGSWLLQLTLFVTILAIVAVPVGEYMACVFEGKRTILSFVLAPIENGLYNLFGIDAAKEMDWKTFALNLIVFNLLGILLVFFLQEIQQWLPLNPQKFGAINWSNALNTAVSYATNTNWQVYPGETNLSYLTKMLGMTVQNFLSAATGMAVAVAFIHGFSRKTAFQIGNFWVLITRSILYILLPLTIILSLVLVSQGTVQNFNNYVHAHTLQGTEQVIAQGPAASQIAIKHLGTNGGGFFAANSAHPYENPTPLTDYLEIFGFLIIAAAFPFAFGAMLNNRRQGLAIFITMFLLYAASLAITIWAEFHGHPLLEKMGIHHGINMEGKELRFGSLSSVVFAVSTTATSTGAVNALHDSFMPLSGLMLFLNMGIGGVIFGGVGSGLIGMLLYAILTMFLIGLMIGRSPEIYGKKLEPYEMVMTVIAILAVPIMQLILSSIASLNFADSNYLTNSGPHGLSEILYAFASTSGNNGSAFGGLKASTTFYNLTTIITMLAGRFLTLLPALAIAGSLAQKRYTPLASRFPTASTMFIIILAIMVITIGALTFLPVVVIGPVLEHFFMLAGKTF